MIVIIFIAFKILKYTNILLGMYCVHLYRICKGVVKLNPLYMYEIQDNGNWLAFLDRYHGHYNSGNRFTIWLLTPLMLCVSNLSTSGATYSLMGTSDDRYLRNIFLAILFTLRVFVSNLLNESSRRNIYLFGCLIGCLNLSLTYNKVNILPTRLRRPVDHERQFNLC